MATLQDLDTSLLLLLSGRGNAWADHFWVGYTSLLTWVPLCVVAVAMLWRTCDGSSRQKLLFILCTLAVVVVLDQASSGLLKPLVGRLRPSHEPSVEGLLHYVDGYRGGRYSFPSGHATNTAGIATWLWLAFRHRLTRVCLVLFAVAMGYSRIYLGVHYPLDIVGGLLLGTSLSLAAHALLTRHFKAQTTKCPTLLLATLAVTLVVLMV